MMTLILFIFLSSTHDKATADVFLKAETPQSQIIDLPDDLPLCS